MKKLLLVTTLLCTQLYSQSPEEERSPIYRCTDDACKVFLNEATLKCIKKVLHTTGAPSNSYCSLKEDGVQVNMPLETRQRLAQKSERLSRGTVITGAGYVCGKHLPGIGNIAAAELQNASRENEKYMAPLGWSIGASEYWIRRLQSGNPPGMFDVFRLAADVMYASELFKRKKEIKESLTK